MPKDVPLASPIFTNGDLETTSSKNSAWGILSINAMPSIMKPAQKGIKKIIYYLPASNGQISDRFRGRVIFPVYSLSGKVLAFGGRILKKDEKMAKYVNSPESDIYHKSHELYGIYQAKQAIVKQDNCFLVEGYTDVLSMHQSGIENVVASSGTSLKPGQIRLIHRFTNNVTVLYDGDAAGIKASLRGIDMLLKEGLHIKVVLLPDGDDPDSFAQKQSAAAFTQYIKEHEVDFIRFKTNLLLESAGQDPVKKAALITDIVQSIAVIPNQIERSAYTKECSQLMEIAEKTLLIGINKIRDKEYQQLKEEELKASQANSNVAPGSDSTTEISNTEAASQNLDFNYLFLKDTLATTYVNDQTEITFIRYIIRYGDLDLFPKDDNGAMWKVASYIFHDLQADEIKFSNPIYQKIREEAEILFSQEEISEIATNCISDKYELSKVHTKYQHIASEEERIVELVPRALFELKDAIITQEIGHIQQQLKRGTENVEEKRLLMQKISELFKVKAALAKELGERTVRPR